MDDFVGCEVSLARAICGRLGHCLGLMPDKSVAPPIPHLVWLGFEVCAERMTLCIPDEKLIAILEECDRWLSRPTKTRRALHSLLGRLGHIVNCILATRCFMSRLLVGPHGLRGPGPSEVDPEIRKGRVMVPRLPSAPARQA